MRTKAILSQNRMDKELATIVIGVISDTHGVLRPGAVEALRGVDRIIHAGDVGMPHVLEALRDIAPVTAVRGNVDRGEWAELLAQNEVLEIGGAVFYVLHDLAELDMDPAKAGYAAVIYGHSHQPSVEKRNGVLFLNPGSAGPRRFDLPVSLAIVQVSGRGLTTKLIDIKL